MAPHMPFWDDTNWPLQHQDFFDGSRCGKCRTHAEYKTFIFPLHDCTITMKSYWNQLVIGYIGIPQNWMVLPRFQWRDMLPKTSSLVGRVATQHDRIPNHGGTRTWQRMNHLMGKEHMAFRCPRFAAFHLQHTVSLITLAKGFLGCFWFTLYQTTNELKHKQHFATVNEEEPAAVVLWCTFQDEDRTSSLANGTDLVLDSADACLLCLNLKTLWLLHGHVLHDLLLCCLPHHTLQRFPNHLFLPNQSRYWRFWTGCSSRCFVSSCKMTGHQSSDSR